jgi:hypothetical protein
MQRASRASAASKEKIGTILNKMVVKKLRDHSSKEGRSISDIVQDAVARYIQAEGGNRDIRLQAASRFCSRPFNLTRTELDSLSRGDYFGR